jgi:flagellar motor switch/type III secretory pathway protein FliN
MADATSSQASETRETTTDAWASVLTLPCELRVELPIQRFYMRDLARLAKGSVVDSKWPITSGVPLLANGERIAWGEFEAVSGRLALRLTEPA